METPPTPIAQAERTTQAIFKYSAWVHVADEPCKLSEVTDAPDYKVGADLPRCEDLSHFHAWVRLPNPLQVKDISEKANAARARLRSRLRDTETDAGAILHSDFDELEEEIARPGIVEEILSADFEEHYVEAVRTVEELESDEDAPDDADEDWRPPKRFANIMQDREEFARMEAADEVNTDAHTHLKAHIAAYEDGIRDEVERLQEEQRQQLTARPWEDLMKIARADRIDMLGDQEYIQTYNAWTWMTCTYKPRKGGIPNERVWGDISHMRQDAAPEILTAVAGAFRELDNNLARSRMAGNS